MLEAYPLQMEALRRDGALPPTRVTVGYATGQREVQAREDTVLELSAHVQY